MSNCSEPVFISSKDTMLQKKAMGFIPNVKVEWKTVVKNLISETERRKSMLETGDKNIMEKQKKAMESNISGIKSSLEAILGDLQIALEQAKGDSLRRLRENCRNNSRLQEHTDTENHLNRHKVTTGALWWKKTHYEYSSYTATYTYFSASDALENIRSFGYDACSQIESFFHKAIDIKNIKRKLMQTILDNFDTTDENFDINHFRLIVEVALNRIEFPVIKLDVAPFIQEISSKFSGEVKDSGDRAKLQGLLSDTMDKLFENVSDQFTKSITLFRSSLDEMQTNFSTELLHHIQREFDVLCRQTKGLLLVLYAVKFSVCACKVQKNMI